MPGLHASKKIHLADMRSLSGNNESSLLFNGNRTLGVIQAQEAHVKYQSFYPCLITQTLLFSRPLTANYSCLDIQRVACTVLGNLDKCFESACVYAAAGLCAFAQPEWHTKHTKVFLTSARPVASSPCKHQASFDVSTCSLRKPSLQECCQAVCS